MYPVLVALAAIGVILAAIAAIAAFVRAMDRSRPESRHGKDEPLSALNHRC
jgi:hypothetical protein